MMQPSAGSQPKSKKQQQLPDANEFLSNFVGEAVRHLQRSRNPNNFQQIANGAIPQTIDYNKQNYG